MQSHWPTRETGFLDRVLPWDEREYRYQIYRPRGEAPAAGWPLILFLHGAGERGRDGLLQTQVGLGAAIRRNASRFPCLAVFPQVSGGRYWSRPDMAAMALACLEQTCQNEEVDRQRLYLVGNSMGGTGVWYLGARYPDTFAALVPVCGGVNYPAAASGDPASAENTVIYQARAEATGTTPVWVFHGADDPVVHVGFSRGMVGAINSLGHSCRYREYAGHGHDAWEPAFEEPELWDWLFRQSRGTPSRTTP
jgi:predicted peptidase